VAAVACLAAGSAGLAAAAKSSREVSGSASVPAAPKPQGPYSKNKAFARCPRGRSAGPAGFSASFHPDAPRKAQVVPSALARKHGAWTVTGVNGGPRKGRITAIAYCSRRPKPPITATDSRQVSTGSSATATATCPRGTKVLLGGARVKFSRHGSPRVVISRERLLAPRVWRIRGYTFGKRTHAKVQTGRLTALAYCGSSPRLSTAVGEVKVAGGSHSTAKARCPSGTAVRFGGFRTAFDRSNFDPALVVSALRSPAKQVWTAKAFNLGPRQAGRMRAYAYCG
jgi:hypothetical protein